MRFLDKPDISVPAERIFAECVDGYKGRGITEQFRNTRKRKRLLQCRDAVRIDSEGYREGILQGSFRKSELPQSVTDAELSSVYSDTFSKMDKPGRRYYDRIKGSVKNNRCPICGNRVEKIQLDHYLPKSEFPTLCVTPDNLVPICPACNEQKGTKYTLEKDRRLLHLYFDRLPLEPVQYKNQEKCQQTFLMARIESDYRVTFFSRYPAEWEPELCSRVENHMRVYNLFERFSNCVSPEIASLWCEWQRKVEKALEDDPQIQDQTQIEEEILQDVIQERVRYYRDSPNTWESALLRGMQAQKEMMYAWFKEHEMFIRDAAIY